MRVDACALAFEAADGSPQKQTASPSIHRSRNEAVDFDIDDSTRATLPLLAEA
jgi:hypothetical protein